MNLKNNQETPITINIGNARVTQEKDAKLLGMTFDDSLQWKSHLYGKGGLISSLNSRMFMIRRLKNFLNHTALLKIVDGLFTSKLRYGLQLMGKVRKSEDDPKNAELQAIQKIQNKLARLMNNAKISDRISSSTLLQNLGMLSVNQLNAQIKLSEMWKATNLPNYPTKFTSQDSVQGYTSCSTRACSNGRLMEEGKKTLTLKTFKSDASRLWNSAPMEIKACSTLASAKKEIKKFVKLLPV